MKKILLILLVLGTTLTGMVSAADKPLFKNITDENKVILSVELSKRTFNSMEKKTVPVRRSD